MLFQRPQGQVHPLVTLVSWSKGPQTSSIKARYFSHILVAAAAAAFPSLLPPLALLLSQPFKNVKTILSLWAVQNKAIAGCGHQTVCPSLLWRLESQSVHAPHGWGPSTEEGASFGNWSLRQCISTEHLLHARRCSRTCRVSVGKVNRDPCPCESHF